MTALHAPRPDGPRRPALRPVPATGRRIATFPFVSVVALVLACGMVGLLVLTTTLQNQAFHVQARQQEAGRLADRLASLQAQAADSRSVQNLAVAAQRLGMRPNPYGAQLQVPDGTVLGKDAPVTGAEIPGVRYLSPEQAQAQLEALAKAEAERKAKLKAQARERRRAEAEARERAEARQERKQKKGQQP